MIPSDDFTSAQDISSRSKVFVAASSSDKLPALDKGWNWHLSSHHSSFPKPGSVVDSLDHPFFTSGLLLPIRFIGLPSNLSPF